MKKIIYTFLDLLTIAFLIGGYVFQYFTRKKLGMLRWVNYQNMQIQKNPVYDVLKSIESFLAYYFLMPFLGAATLMQIIRNGIAVGTKKNEK